MDGPRELIPFKHQHADGSSWTVAVTRTAIDDGLAREGDSSTATSLEQQIGWVDRQLVKLAGLAASKIDAGLVDNNFVYITAADWAGR